MGYYTEAAFIVYMHKMVNVWEIFAFTIMDDIMCVVGDMDGTLRNDTGFN